MSASGDAVDFGERLPGDCSTEGGRLLLESCRPSLLEFGHISQSSLQRKGGSNGGNA